MFDLEGKKVRVYNHEELDCLFEYANKEGWRWGDGDELNKSFGDRAIYPFAIYFKDNKKVYWSNSCNSSTSFKDIEKYINPEKEMTAREFLEWFTYTTLAYCNSGEKCSKCKLSELNTKCEKSLCVVYNWKDHIDELLEIAKSDNVNMSPEEKAIKDIEKLIQEPDHTEITNEIKDSLKLAIEKLKGENENEVNRCRLIKERHYKMAETI